ncbi:MAG: hypothetical protein FWC83_02880, partial [Alphaproteobacteria bacterium]|nr:hypothetical protein [Alphaproteobacteria bacterium]
MKKAKLKIKKLSGALKKRSGALYNKVKKTRIKNPCKNMGVNNVADIMVTSALLLSVIAIVLVLSERIGRYVMYSQDWYEVAVDVQRGDTIAALFQTQGISAADVNIIARQLRTQFNIRHIRAGQDQLVFMRISDDAPVHKIILIPDNWRQIEMVRINGYWELEEVEIERDIRIIRREGHIRQGDSFYVAARRARIPSAVIIDSFSLLAFDIDFERDVRAGQQFSVMYEELYRDGEFITTGSIIKIRFITLRGDTRIYRFRKEDGRVGFYDENGDGATRTIRRTPIANARVTSGFGNR